MYIGRKCVNGVKFGDKKKAWVVSGPLDLIGGPLPMTVIIIESGKH